jgi:hypothetical protein
MYAATGDRPLSERLGPSGAEHAILAGVRSLDGPAPRAAGAHRAGAGRIDVPALRAALWTALALVRTRRCLRRRGLAGANVAAPPRLPAGARRGVLALLRRSPATCLERALILQRWDVAHGAPKDVVIGVTSPADFRAHAWLETEPDAPDGTYREIHRLPAR